MEDYDPITQTVGCHNAPCTNRVTLLRVHMTGRMYCERCQCIWEYNARKYLHEVMNPDLGIPHEPLATGHAGGES